MWGGPQGPWGICVWQFWGSTKESWPHLNIWDLPLLRSRANPLLGDVFGTKANLSPGQSPPFLYTLNWHGCNLPEFTPILLSPWAGCSVTGGRGWGGSGTWRLGQLLRATAGAKLANVSLAHFKSENNSEILYNPQLSYGVCMYDTKEYSRLPSLKENINKPVYKSNDTSVAISIRKAICILCAY